jgi:2-aminoadipate transaminase
MDSIFSDRIKDVPRSFIREILKVTLDSDTISFAGGLPNRALFPVEEIKAATEKVINQHGRDVFQYSTTEGYEKLREFIAGRYLARHNLAVSPEDILITSGSQQGLDLIGKIMVNEGEGVVIEEPGYLGAIQAFSLYKPKFLPVPVFDEGMDVAKLRGVMSKERPKIIYTVPNFQNPSGISYSDQNRRQIAEIIGQTKTFLIEDDPYGELRFAGEEKTSFKRLLPENTILLGSFSKIIVPGFRVGWICAPRPVMDKLITAKQAADLHTSHFTQAIIYQYLKDNDLDGHIAKIKRAYGRQCEAMLESIRKYFPEGVRHTRPEGGMFLWGTLPGKLSSLKLFDLAVKDKVVFVPGDPFYVNKKDTNTMRLNFSCVDETTIKIGIERLGKAVSEMLKHGGKPR